jgi:hypothetical protein
MANITIEIKDELVIAIAKEIGFQYAPDNVPPIEQHIAAIQDILVNEPLSKIMGKVIAENLQQDPAIAAKKAELDSLIKQKTTQLI